MEKPRTRTSRQIIAWFVALLAVSVFFRQLTLFTLSQEYLTHLSRTLLATLIGTVDDLSLLVFVTLLLLVFSKIFSKKIHQSKYYQWSFSIFLITLLALYCTTFFLHYEMLKHVGSGLKFTNIKLATQGVNFGQVASFVGYREFIFLFFGLVVTFSFYALCKRRFFYSITSFILLGACVVISMVHIFKLYFPYANAAQTDFFAEEYSTYLQNPVKRLLSGYLRFRNSHYMKQVLYPSNAQMQSVAFVDSIFTKGTVQSDPSPVTSGPLNIVLFIVESLGAEYGFYKSEDSQLAMPFTAALAQKSLWLSNHYASGNNSLYSIFSLMTGLYPHTNMLRAGLNPMYNTKYKNSFFERRDDLLFPTLSELVGNKYETFYIQPEIGGFYPVKLIENMSVDYYRYDQIPAKVVSDYYVSEVEAIDFYLKKIKSAKKPFFAVYQSNAPHFPYAPFDQTPKIFKGDPYLTGYLNTIHAMDKQIERLYQFLVSENLIDNTLLIIVGDHGEAFGQHLHNFGHHEQSYDENLKPLALIHQPKLVQPGVLISPTSHVDILPTMLYLMGKPFDQKQFQGENIFSKKLQRNYVFSQGLEGTITSVNAKLEKMQVNFVEDNCGVFDLKIDKKERDPLPCDDYPEQLDAILKFRGYQGPMLEQYQAKMAALHAQKD